MNDYYLFLNKAQIKHLAISNNGCELNPLDVKFSCALPTLIVIPIDNLRKGSNVNPSKVACVKQNLKNEMIAIEISLPRIFE